MSSHPLINRKGIAFLIILAMLAGNFPVTAGNSDNSDAIADHGRSARSGWRFVDDMPDARYGPWGVVVNNSVYMMGGCGRGSGNISAANDMYNPVTEKWSLKKNLPTARYEGAIGVIKGIVYLSVGDTNGGFIVSTQAYDPSTDSWTLKKDAPASRAEVASAVLNDELWVMGGEPEVQSATTTVQIYSPIGLRLSP